MSKPIFAFLLLTVLIWPGMVGAHGAGKHVLGTVTALEADHIVVQTKEGKTVSIYVLPTTKYRNRGKGAETDGPGLKIGDRAVVDVTEKDDRLVATVVQFSSSAKKQGSQGH
jgi:hypothetical protein